MAVRMGAAPVGCAGLSGALRGSTGPQRIRDGAVRSALTTVRPTPFVVRPAGRPGDDAAACTTTLSPGSLMRLLDRNRTARTGFIGVIVGAVIATAIAAAAIPLSNVDRTPRVAFVARNDVPFDALAVGPVAGALGGIVVITRPDTFSDAARDALVAFDPDAVIIAGGQAAISDPVAEAIDDAGDWTVSRAQGDNRDLTAAALAQVLDDLGVGRPVLTGGNQVLGDVAIGGTVDTDGLQVRGEDARLVEADDFVRAGTNAAANGDALRSAIAAVADGAAADPVRIRIDAGTFQLDNTLVVPSGVTLVGAGAGLAAPTTIECDSCSTIIELAGGELSSLTVRTTRDGGAVTAVDATASNGGLDDVTLFMIGASDLIGIDLDNVRTIEANDLELYIRATGAGNDAIGIRAQGSGTTDIEVRGLHGHVGVADGPDPSGRHAYGLIAGTNGRIDVWMDTSDDLRVASGSTEAGADVTGIDVAGGAIVTLVGGSVGATTVGGGTADATGVVADGFASLDRTSVSGGNGDAVVIAAGGTARISHSTVGSVVRAGGDLDLRHTHTNGVSGAGGTFRCFASSGVTAGTFPDVCP